MGQVNPRVDRHRGEAIAATRRGGRRLIAATCRRTARAEKRAFVHGDRRCAGRQLVVAAHVTTISAWSDYREGVAHPPRAHAWCSHHAERNLGVSATHPCPVSTPNRSVRYPPAYLRTLTSTDSPLCTAAVWWRAVTTKQAGRVARQVRSGAVLAACQDRRRDRRAHRAVHHAELTAMPCQAHPGAPPLRNGQGWKSRERVPMAGVALSATPVIVLSLSRVFPGPGAAVPMPGGLPDSRPTAGSAPVRRRQGACRCCGRIRQGKRPGRSAG